MESPAIDQLPPVQTQLPAAKLGFFTRENASEYGKLGRQARTLAEQAKAGKFASLPSDEYIRSLHRRVREEIDREVDMLAKTTDAGDKDRLTRALDRLCETERKLSGRPLPGAYRPVEKRESKRSTVEPV